MKHQKYYSQPDVPTSIVCWSFTGMIFLFSMLLWLEITVFQIWTLLTSLLFLVVVFIELKGRYLQFDNDKIIYHTVITFNRQIIDLSKIIAVEHNRWGVIRIKTKNAVYSYLMLPRIAQRLSDDLQKLLNK